MAITCFVKLGWVHRSRDGEWTASEVAAGLQNWLFAIEMMFVSVLHKTVFSHKPYMLLHKRDGRAIYAPRTRHAVLDVFDVRDVAADTKGCYKTLGQWVRGMDDVFDEAGSAAGSRAPTRITATNPAPATAEDTSRLVEPHLNVARETDTSRSTDKADPLCPQFQTPHSSFGCQPAPPQPPVGCTDDIGP